MSTTILAGKKVCVVASSNGGAEAVSPVAAKLRQAGVNVLVLSTGGATNAFKSMNVETDVLSNDIYSDCRGRIIAYKPHVVLTGTNVTNVSGTVTIEQLAWFVAADLKIGSLALVEAAATNLGERFRHTRPIPGMALKFAEGQTFPSTIIGVADETMKKQMLSLDFPESILTVAGNLVQASAQEVSAAVENVIRELCAIIELKKGK